MKGALLLIIVVAIISFILDALTNKCVQKNIEAIPPTLVHHLLYTFALLGWLLDDPAVLLCYIALPFIVLLHWPTNNNTCFIDQATTDICGENTSFNHIAHQFSVPNRVVNILIGI